MRRLVPALAALLLAPSAEASDLAQALKFAQSVMGDEIIEGYEDFVDYDPNEALPLLLARDLQDTETPYEPLYDDAPRQRSQREPHFVDLGRRRLDFPTLRPLIARASEETGLPIALIDAVIRTESGYRPNAVSRTGARGLMQLMPGTAREVGVHDPLDPGQNILGGARYLRRMYDLFGSLRLAIAAYNAGPGAVKKHRGIPPYRETQRYVKVVLQRYQTSAHR